jgi:hypothetical protein
VLAWFCLRAIEIATANFAPDFCCREACNLVKQPTSRQLCPAVQTYGATAGAHDLILERLFDGQVFDGLVRGGVRAAAGGNPHEPFDGHGVP